VWFVHPGTGVLTMMENSPHDDFGSVGLVVVDDVLLHLETAAAREEIVPWSAGSWMLPEHRECVVDRSSIVRMLFSSPGSPGVHRDVFKIPLGGAS
jgi:hypothetical protein